MKDLLRQLQDDGELRADDEQVIASAAWALVHGLATLCIDGQLGPDAADPSRAEELASAATGTLFRGLRADAPASP
jgi:hypothetical protein